MFSPYLIREEETGCSYDEAVEARQSESLLVEELVELSNLVYFRGSFVHLQLLVHHAHQHN